MYPIQLLWKDTNFLLSDVEVWVKVNGGDLYIGNSTDDSKLTLWFSDEPPLSVKEAVEQYWTALVPGCPEAIRYMSKAEIKQKIADLSAGLVTKTWDEMTVTERKLATNQTVTRDDLNVT